MILSLFRIRKPKRFELCTRYYDARRETLDRRITLRKENTGEPKERIRRLYHQRRKVRSSSLSGTQLAVVVLFLLLLAWYIFY